MKNSTIRKNFEKWMKKYYPELSIKMAKKTAIFTNPPYLSSETQNMWVGFCGASVNSEVPQDFGILIEDTYDGFSIVIQKPNPDKPDQLLHVKRFTFNEAEDYKTLKKVFTKLGFEKVSYFVDC